VKSTELIAELAKGAAMSQAEVRKVLEELAKTVQRVLPTGEEVALAGIGKLGISHRIARIGTNPKTGAKVEIPAKRVARLKSSLELRQALA
jgi:DNA-binding protein HU-beta